jgi:GT2 family glycosyltransferase
VFSVVIAAKDVSSVIQDQLRALAAQTFEGPWELIVADNNSSDRTVSVARDAQLLIPSLRVIDASDRRGAGYARNAGAAVARGEFLCFVDADDRVDPHWLEALARGVDHADAIAGQLIAFTVGRDGTEVITDPGFDALPTNRLGFLPNATTANLCVRRQLFEELGGFDDRFGTGEDIDFSWRLQLAGYELRLVRDAVVMYRERDTIADIAKQFFHYGEAMPALYRKFRADGMPKSSTREAAQAWLEICVLWLVAWRSPRTRRGWTKLAAQRAGRIAGSLRCGVFYV